MKIKAILILILCFVSVLSFSSDYELKNSEIKIVFSQEGNNIWVSDIRDEKQGISFLNETNIKEPVWILKVKKDGDYAGEEIILFPKDAREVKTETEKESIVFRWSDVKTTDMETGFDVEAKISLSENNSYWDINISENKEYGFWSVVYPAFSPLDTENNRLMVPFRGGRFYDNYDFDWYYQNPIFLQFMSLTKGKSTLYLCPENLSSSMIYYRIKALGEGNSEYYIENIPGNIAKADMGYKQSYRFNLAVVGGDWFDAAKKYRKWGIENNYAPFSHGKLETRKDLPKWWKELSSCVRWFPFIGDVGKQRVLDTQKFLGLPILAHAYGWSEFIMDTTYPNYLPQRENVIPDIEEFHKNNIYVMPYVNAHITDIKNSAIAHALGDSILNLDEKGEVRDTPWQKNIARNVVSCPTPQYKEAFVGEVTEIMKKLDFDALYIDQLGSTGIYPCFNQKHDHPLGGGTHWVSSYIDLIETLRKDLGEIKGTPVPFTTEDAADGFTFDGWLRCNEGMWETADAPVNTVVFSGYNLSFGDTYYEEELKTDHSQPAINKLAVDFSKGIIPGWEIGAEMNVVPYSDFRDYYRDMVHARYKAKEFFNFGEMVREVKITSPIPTKKILWKHYTGESTEIFPLVRCVSYKYRNKTMVGFTSIALNDPIKISWEAEAEDLYLPKKNMYTIKEIYPKEKTLCKSDEIKYTFTIKPKTTYLFTVE